MPVTPVGANAAVYIYEEATPGTAPTSKNFRKVPVVSWPSGGRREQITDNLIGQGRGGGPSGIGLETFAGSATVPVDQQAIGWWLRNLMGAPATSGSSDYTHVFTSGATTLPTLTAIQAHSDRTPSARYLEHLGIASNSLGLSFRQRTGWANAQIGLIGQRTSAPATSYTLGTTTDELGARWTDAQACMSVGGSEVGYISALDLNFTNGMSAINDTIRCDEYWAEGVDLGMSRVTGSLTVRTSTDALWTAAEAGTEQAIIASWELSATRAISFAFGAKLYRDGSPVTGPGAVTESYRFVGEPDSSGVVLTATLLNGVSAYTYA